MEVKAKPYPVNYFAPLESCENLRDVIPDKKLIQKFHDMYGRHPASIANFRIEKSVASTPYSVSYLLNNIHPMIQEQITIFSN